MLLLNRLSRANSTVAAFLFLLNRRALLTMKKTSGGRRTATTDKDEFDGPTSKKMKLHGTLDRYFKPQQKVSTTTTENEVRVEELLGEKPETDPVDPATSARSTVADLTEPPLSPEQSKMVKEKAIVAKLTREVKSFSILDPNMGPSWFAALENEFRKDYFAKLDKFVTAERKRTTIYPAANHVWEWTKGCAIEDVKVVILGQDPYHGPNQAHGLCFSVKKGIQAPPSLLNIFKELKSDIPDFVIPSHGCLQGWTDEGVLLLNAVLTVEASKANSHKDKGWENITNAVVSWISKNLDSVVFLLWGAHAQKIAAAANVDKKKHNLLTAVHPSPLSAHRGFLGCKHFSTANELLKKAGKTPVNWNNLY